MMSNIACFLHHASCHDLRTFHCQCWLFSYVSILWRRSKSCLSFCSVCNNFVGPVLPFKSYIWYLCTLLPLWMLHHIASLVFHPSHCWIEVMFWSMNCIFQHSIALSVCFLFNLLCFIARMCYSHKEFDCCSFYCSSICLFMVLTIGGLPFLIQHWTVRWLPQRAHFASSITDSLFVLCISTSLLLGNLACQVLW
jgi:hypothetical protein